MLTLWRPPGAAAASWPVSSFPRAVSCPWLRCLFPARLEPSGVSQSCHTAGGCPGRQASLRPELRSGWQGRSSECPRHSPSPPAGGLPLRPGVWGLRGSPWGAPCQQAPHSGLTLGPRAASLESVHLRGPGCGDSATWVQDPLVTASVWAGRVRSSRGLSPNAAPLPACLSATGATFTRKCCAPAVPRSRPEPASRPPPRLHRPATVTEELREGAFSLLYFVLLTTEDNKSSIFGREGSLGSAPGACDLPAPRGSTLSPLGRGVGRQQLEGQ